MRLGSAEYLAEVQRKTNADAEYRRLAANEHDSYTLVLQAEPSKGVMQDTVVGFRVEAGQIVDIWQGERPTDFTLLGPYGVWVDILRGKIGASRAFTMRKLKVRGNFLRLLSGSDSTNRWVALLQSIPTEFDGDYAAASTTGR